MQLTIRDESTDGRTTGETVVEFLTERVTVEELLRCRVYQEVQDYNRQRPERFYGLVSPTDAESTLNGYKLKSPRSIDWKLQFEAAKDAFVRHQVLVFVDERQVTQLDQTIELRPATSDSPGTSATFLKLTPLVGG